MSREVDLRDFSVSKITPEREAELRAAAEQLSGQLPGGLGLKITRFDPTTGNPAVIKFQGAGNATGEGDNRVLRVLARLQRLGPILGLAPGQGAEFVAAPTVQETSGGARVVQLQQFYKSIPIFEALQTVRLTRNDSISQISGRTVSVNEDLSTVPAVTVEQAVRRAAEHAAGSEGDGPPTVDLAGFQPRVVASFVLQADRPTVLEPGPFQSPISASLTWFPNDRLRLAWDVLLAMPDGVSRFRTLVDAQDGTILYSRQLTRT
jgi:extracellular elastinolytic metalloproteinase